MQTDYFQLTTIEIVVAFIVHIGEIQHNIVKGKTQEIKQGPPFYVVTLTRTKHNKYEYKITYNSNMTKILI